MAPLIFHAGGECSSRATGPSSKKVPGHQAPTVLRVDRIPANVSIYIYIDIYIYRERAYIYISIS